MGNLTKNLSRSEFKCKCGNCDYDTIDFELIEALQQAANDFQDKYFTEIWIEITSGNRCPKHNKKLRKEALEKKKTDPNVSVPAKKSSHIDARASDTKYFLKDKNGKKGKQIDPENVAEYFEEHYPHFGIGRYNNRTHIDSRTDGPARW